MQYEALPGIKVPLILADRDAIAAYMEDQRRFREWVGSCMSVV